MPRSVVGARADVNVGVETAGSTSTRLSSIGPGTLATVATLGLFGEPRLSPNGRRLAVTAIRNDGSDMSRAAQRISTGERMVPVEGGVGARDLPAGHLA